MPDEKVSEIEVEGTMLEISVVVAGLITTVRALDRQAVADWICHAQEQLAHHDAIGPIMDPTGYFKKREAVKACANVAEGFGKFYFAVIENAKEPTR